MRRIDLRGRLAAGDDLDYRALVPRASEARWNAISSSTERSRPSQERAAIPADLELTP